MARHRDSRSPSPAGRYASSKRGRRDDDLYARGKKDEGRLTYQRSRSPEAADSRQRNRDRDHRDREPFRDRDRDRERGAHRDHAQDRRPRERSPVPGEARYRGSRGGRERDGLDRRHRSRDRFRDPRDERREREREPRHRDDYDDGRYRSRRDGHKDGRDGRDGRRDDRSSRPTTAPGTPKTPKDEDDKESKKAEKLAKLEAWKKKKREEREKQEAPKDTRTIWAEIDAREPRSSVSKASVESENTNVPADHGVSSAQPDVAYAGKFDPKAFAKKATTSTSAHGALGQDIALPASTKTSATFAKPQTNGSTTSRQSASTNSNDATKLKNKGNVQAFGFGNKTQQDAEKDASKKGLDLGESEGSRRTLEKLPSLPTASNDVSANANGINEAEDDQEDGIGAAATEEEEAAIARAAAEHREERLLNDSVDASHRMDIDGGGEATSATTGAPNTVQDTAMADADEDIDPLDAFMTGLEGNPTKKAPGLATVGNSKAKQQEPEAIFSDDDDERSAMNNNPNDILEMAQKAKKKKDIPPVNHGTMHYEPFRKSFYTEPDELREMSEEETANLRLELEGIKVRGVDVPKPVRKWPHLGLGVQSLKVIQELGYEAPTAIQSQAVPAVMSGRDVIGVAKTGSGKTIAFLLPMFRHIKDQPPLAALDGPVGLIMTPTRELATQIHKECKPWLKALNLRAVCCYGGAPIKDQIADLKRGAEIIVCTPGRMIDLLAANAGRVTNLRRVTYLVLDEADRMFDMGFEPQVMRILNNVRPSRQTVLFSATFPPKMEALARKALTKPVEITVGGRSTVGPEIEQVVEVRPENSKFLRVLQLLGEVHMDEDARSLIFVDRQEGAEELMNAILRKGYPCFTIHGAKDQFDRDTVISDFKAGIFPVLIATSVAARGLDVKQLKLVVNFDCPNHMEDYVHRAGRTGRAGNTGLAVTFITENQQRYAPDIVKALKASGVAIPEPLKKLADTHLENVKSGKDKAAAFGFGGKGLAEAGKRHDAEKRRMRGLFKTGDDDADNDDREMKDEDKFEEAIVVKALDDAPDPKPAVAEALAPNPAPAGQPLRGVPAGIDLDGAVKVIKTEPAAAPPRGKDRMASAAAAAESINARLRKAGDIRGNAPIDNKGPDAGAFHATLEINDFPQKARWAVTNRTNVAKILESTGTSITSKGNYYPNGTVPGPDQPPKLYILVEGDTENVVTGAMRELMRLLKDGTTAAMESEARAPAGGRYTV